MRTVTVHSRTGRKEVPIEEQLLDAEATRVKVAETFDKFVASLTTPQKVMWKILREEGGLAFPPETE